MKDELEMIKEVQLSQQKIDFCLCDAIPRKVKLEVIDGLEKEGSEDSLRMLKLLRSLEE